MNVPNQKMNDEVAETNKNFQMRKWLARFGLAGFMFFLIKGLVWLAVIFGIGKCVV
jgi:hypothetical protein